MNYRVIACGKMTLSIGMDGALADIINKLEVCQNCDKKPCETKTAMEVESETLRKDIATRRNL